MTKIHVRSGERLADAIGRSKRERHAEIINEAAIGAAKAVEAARLDEREQIAKMIEKMHGDNWCRPDTWTGCVARDNLAHQIRKRI